MTPETRYANSGGVSIAYQVLGAGALDLVVVPGWVSNLDVAWEEPAVGDSANITGAIEEFLTGVRHHQIDDRVLATVMFTDIVGATEADARLGDKAWRALLTRHHDAVRPLGIELRAGVHTGECEVMGDKYGGIAVHIGARIAACAAAGEVLVSRTVRDLVSGSGLVFDDRGVQPLKGVPGEWPLFAVQR